MPSRLNSPVITVDMANISKVDPSNVDNLFSMWTIFSKCAESLENGRRLENLSWRLWNRETFCCDDNMMGAAATTAVGTKKSTTSTLKSATPPIRTPRRQNSETNTFADIPELSSSVESASSDDELPKERSARIGIETSRPCVIRTDSADRYRGKEKHMTPEHLAKLMEDIDRNKSNVEEWMSERPQPTEVRKTQSMHITNDNRHKMTTSPDPISSVHSTSSVIRGFSPGRVVSSYRSSSAVALAQSPSKDSKPAPAPKKSKPVFFLGSSSSSHSDDEFEERYVRSRRGEKKAAFRKSQTLYEDDSSDDMSESAIEEDDCSEWESSTESELECNDDRVMFKRVESKPELTSRRSLLSTMLHEPERAAALQCAASRSSPAIRHTRNSPRGNSIMPVTREEGTHQLQSGISRSRPIILTTSNVHPPAMSPRTTIKNMITTEWPESLRKNLLWERQHRNTTASAHLKRRHTAHDVSKLTEYPAAATQLREPSRGCGSKNNSWNYFDEGHHEYHATGW